MASLYVIRGRDLGKRFELTKARIELGRDSDNDFQVHDTEVSRHHAAINLAKDGFEIVDLESSNGTFLNSQRVTSKRLENGDRIQIGKTLMIFSGDMPRGDHSSTIQDVDIVRPNPAADIAQIRKALASDPVPMQDTTERWGAKVSGDVQAKTPAESASPQAHWEIVYRTALAVSRTLDIDSLLRQILDLIFQWVHCDRGCIMLVDDESNHLQPACRRNRLGLRSQDRMEISKTILDYVIERSEGVYTSNAIDDTRFDSAASIVSMGIREAICVPMQGRYGVVGAIYIDTSTSPGKFAESGAKQRFTEDHLKLMIAIGNQAALAIEDTFYYRGMVQSERLAVMGQTIATVSHHIKNILQGIRSGSYMVEEGLRQSQLDPIAKGWKIVQKNQERIASLVLDMLTYSKERTPQLRKSDPRLMIDDVVEMMESRAKEQSILLTWDRPADFPLVEMDQEAMHRALLNVLINGMDAVEQVEKPRIQVELKLDQVGRKVVIEVRDNGVGISEEQLTRVFQAFESSKGSSGTGLGLAVSQKILQEHGGDVEVKSQPGNGSCFSLVWPVCGPHEPMDSSSLNRPTVF